jgi:hypothetical protein
MPAPDAAAQSLGSRATGTEEPTETRRSSTLTPVYWLGQNDGTVYLYREFSHVPDLGDPVVSAVSHMLNSAPADPDYFSVWRPAEDVGASFSGLNEITLDLPSSAFGATLDAGVAARAVQQLVYTATAAAANAGLTDTTQPLSVIVLVDGHRGHRAFGHVDLGGPLQRERVLAAPIWVIDPQQDASVPGRVAVRGTGVSADALLDWEVLELDQDRKNPRLVDSGEAAIGAAGGTSGPYEFTVELDPGTYELRVFDDPADAGTRLSADSKVFNVVR